MDLYDYPLLFPEEEEKAKFVSKKKGRGTAERLNDYDAFLKKFGEKKTTDDCYTPPAVYAAVIGWLKSENLITDDTPIVRPFYPGFDYRGFL
ncbi:MAG: hypothetical protein IJS19_09130 [Muribaculaceae bacterium]|nr:hypothetical protein [Muribaculaceae bacterium]